MQIFKTKWFARFARNEGIADRSLLEAIERTERGLIDADLGGGLIKQRVARRGQGRSGGYCVIVAYRARHLAVSFYGFAKSERPSIDSKQLATARKFAAKWLAEDPASIDLAIDEGELLEVEDD